MNSFSFFKKLFVLIALVVVLPFTVSAQQISQKCLAEDLMKLSYSLIELPVDYGTMILTKTEVTDEAIEYFYVCKTEEVYDYYVNSYGEVKASIADLMRAMVNTKDMLSMLLCIDAEKSIIYNYTAPSGKSFTLTFLPSAIQRYIGVQEITPQIREEAVRLVLVYASNQYSEDSPSFFILEEINKKSFCFKQSLDGYIEKNFKYNLARESLMSMLKGEGAAIYPFYSLYAGKGYKHTIVDRINKKSTKGEVSYEELAWIYLYVKEEQAKKEAEQAIQSDNMPMNQNTEDEEPMPFQLVDLKPTFQGGDANSFSKWVNERLVYPEISKKNKDQGRVVLQFTIGKDGTVRNVKVLRGVSPELDAEAVRVVSMSPAWTPGYLASGEPVSITYTFPVIFMVPQQ